MKHKIIQLKEAINRTGQTIYPAKWDDYELSIFLKSVSQNMDMFSGDGYFWDDRFLYVDIKLKIYRDSLNSFISWVLSGALQLFTYETNRPLYFNSKIIEPRNIYKIHDMIVNGKICDSSFEDISIYEGETIYVYKDELNKCLGLEDITKSTGGRPPKFDWLDILCMLLARTFEDDILEVKKDGSLNQTLVIDKIQSLYETAYPNETSPSETAIKENIIPRLKHWHDIRKNITREK